MIARFYDWYQTHSHEFCLLLLLNTSNIVELKVVVGPSNQRIDDLVPLNQDIQPKIVIKRKKIDFQRTFRTAFVKSISRQPYVSFSSQSLLKENFGPIFTLTSIDQVLPPGLHVCLVLLIM